MDLYIFQHIVLQDYKNLDTGYSLDHLNTWGTITFQRQQRVKTSTKISYVPKACIAFFFFLNCLFPKTMASCINNLIILLKGMV